MKKKILIAAAVLLAAALLGFLGRRQFYYLYRDIAYYFGERSQAEQVVHDYARQQRISYGKYPFEIIGLLEGNPEMAPFVLSYPYRESAAVDLKGFNQEKVPLFLQWDPMWGYENYGSGYLALTGCGPTCLAMAGYYLTGDEAMNPRDVARFAEENGHYVPGAGSAWTLFVEGAAALGLNGRQISLEKQSFLNALNAGHPVVLSMAKGDFTTTGHFIVLTGVEDGLFQVNDPNSPLRSEKLWSFERLLPQIKNAWELSAGGKAAG